MTSALDEGGWSTLRSVDLVRVVFYVHESARAFAETSCLSHGFLGASKKAPRLIRSRLHAVVVGLWVIHLPEHPACIEQMLKQFASCFNASRPVSADIRDETSVVCANRILHAGTHCALSGGDAMTQAFTHIARVMLSGGAMQC